MTSKTYTVLVLLMTSTAAFAWRPLTYPMRSQSPYERGIDNAMCYAEASRVSKVSMVHESQIPPRPTPAAKSSSTGVPSKPPLPPSSFSATPLPWSASMPDAASAPTAAAPMGASSAKPANEAAADAGGTPGATAGTAGGTAGTNTAATAAAGASATAPATTTQAATPAASASLGTPGAPDASLQANAGSGVKLPPLPAPEPPMTRYWAAYSACMQARGYFVQ
ncbi:hypothetical protein [Paraburkholderia antibiotica]|uniref:Uncharacterized protein n=1 Tax=Paraburkholderia antibiotica TaxID=2728839 RepID=A0A7X9X3J7_9BURK|nr:hypothetical protein [Paraburkholderia antibiotica]NML30809.1 hypothetical protein [Paraburkholderia antibiotica]